MDQFAELLVLILAGAIRAGTPVLFVCLGEVIIERSGLVNLGMEGSMLVGAMVAFATTSMLGNPWMGVVAGGLAGMLMALIFGFFTILRNTNQLATGLAILILGNGITAFFGRSFVNKQIQGINPINIPGLSDLPILGPVLFSHDVLTYLAVVIAVGLWLFLYRTRGGLVLRAVGERDEVAYACGYAPTPVRFMAVAFGGFMAGLGGAYLSVAYTLNWIEGMTQGRGIVAVALVIFASWSPLQAIFASYLFGGAQALQLALQSIGVDVSPFLLTMVPYLLTLGVLLFVGRRRRYNMPESLAKVFSTVTPKSTA